MNKNEMNGTPSELISGLMDDEWDNDASLAKSLDSTVSDKALCDKFARYHLAREVMHSDKGILLDSDFSARVSAAIAAEPALDVLDGSNKYNAGLERSKPVSNVADLSAKRAKRDAAASQSVAAANVSKDSGFNWKVGAGGFAIAASVALVSLVGLNTFQNSGNDVAGSVAGSNAQNAGLLANNDGKLLQGVELQQVAAQSNAVVPVANSLTANSEQPVIQIQGGYGSPLEYVSNSSTYWVTPDQKRNSITEKRLNMFLSQHIEQSPTADLGGMIPYSRLAGYDTAPAVEQQ